jgi:hypothetical protein
MRGVKYGSGEVPDGGGVGSASDVSVSVSVLRLALMYFHSSLTIKVVVETATPEMITIPICFAKSYPRELLLTEPGGEGAGRDGVGFPIVKPPIL